MSEGVRANNSSAAINDHLVLELKHARTQTADWVIVRLMFNCFAWCWESELKVWMWRVACSETSVIQRAMMKCDRRTTRTWVFCTRWSLLKFDSDIPSRFFNWLKGDYGKLKGARIETQRGWGLQAASSSLANRGSGWAWHSTLWLWRHWKMLLRQHFIFSNVKPW